MASYTDVTLYRRLLRQARFYWPHIGGIFLLSLLSSPLALLTPLPLKIAVDSVIGSHPLPGFLDALLPAAITGSDGAALLIAAGLLVAVSLLSQLQELATSLLRTYAGERLVLGFRAQLFRHLQRLSLTYSDSKGTSDSTYRIQYDAPAIQFIAIDGVIPFISAGLTIVGMIYVTARIDWQLALVALGVSPVLFLVSQAYRRRLRKHSREVKKLESSALSVVQEVLAAIRVVKAFGQEEREQERFVRRSSEGMRARIRLALAEGGFGLLVGLTTALGTSAVLFIGIRHVQLGVLTLGELLLVMSYLSQLYAPLKTMSRKAASLQSHLAGAERAFALLDEAPDVVERPTARPLARAAGAVAFRNVSFAYEQGRAVLHDLSFEIPAGARVGITGTTGAGKTTLVSLLTRFYDPTAGQILLDGADLRDYKLADLRNQFAIVLQEPVLFSTSIAENIAYARPGASEREIAAAAQAAGAHDFITRLPQNYETLVGERGMRLSGGERQRIALARAFLKDAPILILDEPTSSVDLRTEAAIMEAMERLMHGRTTFMIAHRLSTLDMCDVRIEIEHGRINTISGCVSSTPPKRTKSITLPLQNGTNTLPTRTPLPRSPVPLERPMALQSYRDFLDIHNSRKHTVTSRARATMNTQQLLQLEPDAGEAREQMTPVEIERVIESIGARYIADLRTLSEEFGRFYTAQLAAKDEQIAEISRSLAAAEHERDALKAQIHDLMQASARYIAQLRALSEELPLYMDVAEHQADQQDHRVA